MTERAGLAAGPSVDRFGQDYAAHAASDGASASRRPGDEIAPLGFDERFRRIWRFYLAYCEAGFRTGRTDVVQLAGQV